MRTTRSIPSYLNQLRRSALPLEDIADKHLMLLVVNPGTVLVHAPTMDSSSECFRWARLKDVSLDTVTHHLNKQEQHIDTLQHRGMTGHPGHANLTDKERLK